MKRSGLIYAARQAIRSQVTFVSYLSHLILKRRRQILNRNGFKDVKKDRITKQQYGPLIYKLKLLIFWNFSDLIGSCSEDNV